MGRLRWTLAAALIVLLWAPAATSQPTSASIRFAKGETCCPGCSYQGSCCCAPQAPVTKKVTLRRTATRTTTKPRIATKTVVKTVSVSTVVVKQQRAGRRRAREIRSWEEPAITEDNAPDMSETAPSLNENLEERSELDERSAVEERQAIPTPNLESLRNLCPACPANATLVTSGRTAELSYCCPPRRTITQTKTIVARIVTKTAFQKSAVLRTRTVTKVVPYIVAATQTVRVQIFRDINSNGVYDASQDLPIVGTAVELLKLGGGSATQLDNGTTAADGTVDFLTDRIVAFDNLAVAYLGNGTVLTTIQVGSNGKLPAGTTIPVVVATGPLPGTTTKTHTISATSRTNTVTKSLTATATAATSTATHTKSLTSTASKSATTTTPLVVPDPLSVWQIQDGCFPNFFEERLPNAGNSPDAAYRSCYPSCDRRGIKTGCYLQFIVNNATAGTFDCYIVSDIQVQTGLLYNCDIPGVADSYIY